MDGLFGTLTSAGMGMLGAYMIMELKQKQNTRDLEDQKRLAAMTETRLKTVEKDCKRHGEILSTIQSLTEAINKLSEKVEKSIEADARQSEALKNLTGYVSNLREDIGSVRADLNQHIFHHIKDQGIKKHE